MGNNVWDSWKSTGQDKDEEPSNQFQTQARITFNPKDGIFSEQGTVNDEEPAPT